MKPYITYINTSDLQIGGYLVYGNDYAEVEDLVEVETIEPREDEYKRYLWINGCRREDVCYKKPRRGYGVGGVQVLRFR